MTAIIRDAEAGDRDRLVDLFQTLNRHEDALLGDRRIDRGAAEENLDSIAARAARTEGRMFVAEAGGEVAGLLALLFNEDNVYVRAELRPHAEISTIVVDGRFRRQGVARALMDAAESAARDRGYRRIRLTVVEGNTVAEAAYARQGFRPRSHELEKPLV